MSSTVFVSGVTLTQAGWFQDVDNIAYQYLSGVAGTNTITATGPAGLGAYAAGLKFRFIPAATNTGATTINITGTAALGARNIFLGGAALIGGELTVGVPVEIIDDGTRFILAGFLPLTTLTNSIAGDVALNNTANYFDGPSVAQGTTGKWFASGTVTLIDTGSVAGFRVKLWDGTTVISSLSLSATAANVIVVASLSGVLTSPAGNIRISVKDTSATTGVIKANVSTEGKDSTITVVKLA